MAAIAHNLLRAAGCLASRLHAKARGATLRDHSIKHAGRVAAGGHDHITMHLPEPGLSLGLIVKDFAALRGRHDRSRWLAMRRL